MPRSKVQRNEIKYKFRKHEIVWAKTAGYSWWPASITCMPSKNKYFYKVDFIGDRSYAWLSEQKLAAYVQFRDEYESIKKADKQFINAVTIAGKKYEQWVLKQVAIMKSKGSVECKTSQQKQQLNKQIQLPQIPENIQQLSSHNQPHFFIKSHPNLHHNNQTEALVKPFEKVILDQDPSIQQQPQEAIFDGQNQQENIPIVDDQNREKFIQELLAKYKLNAIPDLKQLKNAQKQKQKGEKDKRKPHWKRKLITKRRDTQKYSNQQDQFSQQDLMARKIYRYLMCKLQSTENSRLISLSLRQQILGEKIQRVECFRKVMEWIQVTEPQNIVSYHSQWINFYKDTNERERQKHSSLTMEDQSEEISVK